MKKFRPMAETDNAAGSKDPQEEEREFETMSTPFDTRIDRLTDRADAFFSGLLF